MTYIKWQGGVNITEADKANRKCVYNRKNCLCAWHLNVIACSLIQLGKNNLSSRLIRGKKLSIFFEKGNDKDSFVYLQQYLNSPTVSYLINC